jgi:hypothetical protein
MRFDRPATPIEGDERTIHGFLFLPRHIAGQVRWLEFATIRQRMARLMVDDEYGPEEILDWIDIAWVNP